MSVRRRTGAGIALNPDNIVLYWIIVCLLVAAVVAAGVASVEGLLHAAAWMVPPALQWTLPVAVDVFLVGTALATLALRKRGARRPVIFLSVVTLALVAFSSVANYLYVLTSTEPGTEAHMYGPWIKAAMPVLLLAAVEIVATLTSTRNQPAARAARAKAKSRAKGRRRTSRRQGTQPVPTAPVWSYPIEEQK